MADITLRSGIGWAGSGLTLQPGEKTVIKRNGIAERTSIFMSFGYPSFVPIPLYTPYPDQSTGGFVCDETQVESLPGGFYRTTVKWVSLFQGATSYTTYESKLIQVPIAQSPNFVDIAGTPDDPINGAAFDDNGIFLGFSSDSPYAGVVSAFIQQDLMIVHGSGTSQPIPNPSYFCESLTATIRGAVWEYEITYNLDINVDTGIPTSDD
jgi:hypothetical protein